jgi:hypothetical protein
MTYHGHGTEILDLLIQRHEEGQSFVVLQKNLTADNRAHEVVFVSVFAVRLTNDLNPRSPVYSTPHVC